MWKTFLRFCFQKAQKQTNRQRIYQKSLRDQFVHFIRLVNKARVSILLSETGENNFILL